MSSGCVLVAPQRYRKNLQFLLVVRGEGLEPSSLCQATDFKSAAYTNSAIRAKL